MDTATLTLFDRLAESQKTSLANSFRQRHETLASTNTMLLRTTSECRQQQWKTHEFIWNPCLFLNTAAFDLSFLVHDLAYEEDIWKRGLTARHLASLMFEIAEDLPQVFGKDFIAEDLPQVFGKDFNDALTVLRIDEKLRADFRRSIKSISKFWNEHRSELKVIRTISGAHRDHDAILLLQTIEKLDLFNILKLGISLGTLMNDIGPAAEAILIAASNIKPPELEDRLKS